MQQKVSAPQLYNALIILGSLRSYSSQRIKEGLGEEKEELLEFVDTIITHLYDLKSNIETFFPEAESQLQNQIKIFNERKGEVEKIWRYKGQEDKSYRKIIGVDVPNLLSVLDETHKTLERFERDYPNLPKALLEQRIKNVEEKIQSLSEDVKTNNSKLRELEVKLFRALDVQESRIENRFNEIKMSLEKYSTQLRQLEFLRDLAQLEEPTTQEILEKRERFRESLEKFKSKFRKSLGEVATRVLSYEEICDLLLNKKYIIYLRERGAEYREVLKRYEEGKEVEKLVEGLSRLLSASRELVIWMEVYGKDFPREFYEYELKHGKGVWTFYKNFFEFYKELELLPPQEEEWFREKFRKRVEERKKVKLQELELYLEEIEEKIEDTKEKMAEIISRPQIYEELRKEVNELRERIQHMENYLKSLPQLSRYIPRPDLKRVENKVLMVQALVSQRSVSTVGQVKEGIKEVVKELDYCGFSMPFGEMGKQLYKAFSNLEEKARLDEESIAKLVDNTGKWCSKILEEVVEKC